MERERFVAKEVLDQDLTFRIYVSVEMYNEVQFSSVQSLSRVWLFVTPWIAARQASLSITNSWSSFTLTSIESVMPSSHLILCRPLFLLPPIPPSDLTKVLVQEHTYMQIGKYRNLSFLFQIPEMINLWKILV